MKYKTVSPGITRFEVEGSTVRGYLVRMRRNGSNVSEFYSDADYGGKRNALVVAKEAYQKLLKKMGPIVSPTKNRLTNRNTSGQVGVHTAYSVDNRYPNSQSWSYCASWISDDGKREKISFSFAKYGQEVAWELACLARQKMISNRERVVALYESGAKPKAVSAKAPAKKASVKKATAKKVPVKKAAPTKKAASKSQSVKKSAKKKAPVKSKTATAKRTKSK
jgi:hypothetical protein